ncbi:hypothetical protein M6B22_07190 [Jatrophihabitans cynanchi]|uniref:HNH nuclease domain-containing protein n=1 Tax=Jatrophihabitans cynanchi TaxID=2944128 RepID=A0ABY7K111_9ACTN|nr:hypothetical protein [Jatrophihabitans sp. SB3-54]WAX58541.1 hypothetical protein M6B22_07190 [Jatrophihabitans sp. SB3-54]
MIEVDLPPKVDTSVVRTPGCWFWVGSLSDDGYPTMQLGSARAELRTVRVHRYVCQLQWGGLGETEKALHTCDETSCARPLHLYPGSQAANLAQMARRGRYQRGLADVRGAGGRARGIRAALSGEWNPGALQAAMLAGDPRRDQLVLF